MSEPLRRLERAAELPAAWDTLASCYFQRRAFLQHAEAHNPCRQRYYLLERGGQPAAAAVVYTLPLDLLTFAGVPSPVRMHLVGVPCSVSAPGLWGGAGAASALAAQLLHLERGLLVGLNLDAPLEVEGLLQGRTLPTVLLDRRFGSFEEYLGALRSGYRRRLSQHRGGWEGVLADRGDCARFDEEAYRLYLQVFARSDAKLERLTLPFFQNLPPPFTFTRYLRAGRLAAWHICLADGARFYFFLGGVDAAVQGAYFNVLLGVLREGIAAGAGSIDFGQTAEVPKTRLGGRVVEKHLFASHPNALVRWTLGHARGLLEYRRRVPQAHVFREPAAPA